MATTRLSDVIVPEDFAAYIAENTAEKTRVMQSGLVTRNPQLDAAANSGSNTLSIPFWQDLGNDEANVGSDDPAAKSTPKKVGAGQMNARVAYLNQAWSSMDLSGELAGSDPADRIASRVAAYWQRQFQKRVIQASMGVLADNEANDGGDMVHNVATDVVGAPSAAELFSVDNFVESIITLGDSLDAITAVGVHSVVYATMLKNDQIEFIQDSVTGLSIPQYKGKDVIVDDGLSAVAGTNRITYTSILFGQGAFGYGMGSPKVPVETDRDPTSGNGSGEEVLYTRNTWLLHPAGFDFTSASLAGLSATQAELATAANWDRKFERKNIPLTFLKTNG